MLFISGYADVAPVDGDRSERQFSQQAVRGVKSSSAACRELLADVRANRGRLRDAQWSRENTGTGRGETPRRRTTPESAGRAQARSWRRSNATPRRFKTVPKRPLRVLIVDDEEPVRKFVERVMSEAGYETATASDGPEALEAAETFEPIDVLVTDVMMPQMAGDELARRFRQKRAGTEGPLSDRVQRPVVQGEGHALGRRGVPRQAVQREGPRAGGVAARLGQARLTPRRLAAARVHLEVRVLLERSHRHEGPAIAQRQPIFGAAVRAPLPRRAARARRSPPASRPPAARPAGRCRAPRRGTGTTGRRPSAGCGRSSRRRARSSTR